MIKKSMLPSVLCVTLLHGCSGSVNDVGGTTDSQPGSSTSETPAESAASTPEPDQGAALSGDNTGLFSIHDLSFVGAFVLPVAENAVSSLNYSSGIIEVNGDSLFVVGHDHHDAIAEFVVPDLVDSNTISDLNSAGAPRQAFITVIDRAAFGNPEALDEIVGMELVNNSLVINASEYYDAPADNQLSTLVVDNAFDLENATVGAFRSMEGLSRAAGWISRIPEFWQSQLGGTHISGHSSGGPIIGRHSVGPSAFAINLDAAVNTSNESVIPANELLGFSLEDPLNEDLYNTSGVNDLWTHLSQARYGFIVPGTRTYMTIGSSGGHESGVGYKINQSEGSLCGGYCSTDFRDNYNYYWLWDLDEMLQVAEGSDSPVNISPYEYGQLDLPFQTNGTLNRIGGASYDATRDLLYISIRGANNEVGEYNNPPIIAVYKLTE